jgi:hypothetical protein
MVIRTVLALLLGTVSSQIWAMPIARNVGCNSSSYERGFSDLIHKVRVTGRRADGTLDDGRMAIVRLAAKHQWTPAKLDLVLKNTGEIFCPWLPSSASASIVGSGLTLLTAKHVFYDESGQPRGSESDFRNCYFTSFDRSRANLTRDGKPKRHYLGFKPGSFQFGKNKSDGRLDKNDDWGVIKMDLAVSGAKGFPVFQFSNVSKDPIGDVIRNPKDIKFLNVSTTQDDTRLENGQPMPSFTPTAQYCSDITFVENNAGAVKIDCDSSPGISGSLVLAESGETMVATAVISGGVGPNSQRNLKNGDAYDVNSNYTRAAAINDRIISALEQIGGRVEIAFAVSL